MSKGTPPVEARVLGAMFTQVATPVSPAAYSGETFLHYSLPAFDEFGGPNTETGAQIESNKTLLQDDCILVSKLNPRKPRVQLVRKSLSHRQICSTEFVALVSTDDSVDLAYFRHLLSSEPVQRNLDAVATGTTNSHVRARPRDLLKQSVFAPPLPEQRRIAEILDTLDDQIRTTELIIAKRRILADGLRDDLFLGRSGNSTPRRASQFGDIPEDWDVRHLDELVVHVGSGLTPRGGSHVYQQDGILFIRSQNVHFDGLRLDDVAFIDERTNASMARSELCANDVLLNITGASIGRCCRMPSGLGRANVNQHVCAIRLTDSSRDYADYLSGYLGSPLGQRQVDVLNAGGNREGLNYQQVRAFQIIWPPPEERSRIAAILNATHSGIDHEIRKLHKLKTLKKGLMADLLTGRVRAPVGATS